MNWGNVVELLFQETGWDCRLQTREHETCQERIHANRTAGGDRHHCDITGNPDACFAKGQGGSARNGLQGEFEERGIGRANVP